MHIFLHFIHKLSLSSESYCFHLKSSYMKNKQIADVRTEIKVYEAHYKPSLNVFYTLRSIMGVLLFGQTTVAPSLRRRK
ncbi:hypothetical protein GCM10028786_23840 [Flaviaesturariibacter terrae]